MFTIQLRNSNNEIVNEWTVSLTEYSADITLPQDGQNLLDYVTYELQK